MIPHTAASTPEVEDRATRRRNKHIFACDRRSRWLHISHDAVKSGLSAKPAPGVRTQTGSTGDSAQARRPRGGEEGEEDVTIAEAVAPTRQARDRRRRRGHSRLAGMSDDGRRSASQADPGRRPRGEDAASVHAHAGPAAEIHDAGRFRPTEVAAGVGESHRGWPLWERRCPIARWVLGSAMSEDLPTACVLRVQPVPLQPIR